MREPLKTRLIALCGLIIAVSSGAAACYVVATLGKPQWFLAILTAASFVGALLTGVFLSRIEYGEWAKGQPWWVRMEQDGYRPPIKLPTDDPRT